MNVQRGDLRGAVLADGTVGADVGPASGWHAPSVFAADTHTGADYLGRTTSAAFLAEVVAHRTAETPFSIGIFGPAGSGKSSFMASLLAAVERLDEAAQDAGIATPFLPNLVVARVEAEAGSPPASSLMRQVAAALRAAHPRLAAEAAHAGLDHRTVSRRASEALLDVRQRLDAERRNLDGLRGRQARLPEALLFETPGSTIDEHTRRHRGRIERTMRGFGFGDDALTAYKNAVRDTSEHDGGIGRWLAGLRAFWDYRGQGRLLVLAVALFLAAWGLGTLDADQDRVIDAVRSGGDKLGPTADWLAAHWHWLTPAKSLLELAGVAALALNILRGIRFLLPIHRGTRLLQGELDSRRRELDGLLAHGTRRVDTLAREADAASQHAAEAEARVATTGAGIPALPPDEAGQAQSIRGIEAARIFFAAIGQAMRAGSQDRLASSTSAAPARVVVGIDGLDDLPASEAAAYLQTARNLLARPGFVIVATSDRLHLLNGLAEADPALATARLNRLVQIPYTLADEGDFGDAASFARALLGSEPPNAPSPSALPTIDGRISALDRPWTDAETAIVEALAPFAGSTPRAVKRFVNLYRVARADPRMGDAGPKDLAALAVGLALQSAGSPADPRQVATSGGVDDDARQVRKAASTALATPLSALDGERGYDTARIYSTGR